MKQTISKESIASLMYAMGCKDGSVEGELLCDAILFPSIVELTSNQLKSRFAQVEMSIYGVFISRVAMMRVTSPKELDAVTEKFFSSAIDGLAWHYEIDMDECTEFFWARMEKFDRIFQKKITISEKTTVALDALKQHIIIDNDEQRLVVGNNEPYPIVDAPSMVEIDLGIEAFHTAFLSLIEKVIKRDNNPPRRQRKRAIPDVVKSSEDLIEAILACNPCVPDERECKIEIDTISKNITEDDWEDLSRCFCGLSKGFSEHYCISIAELLYNAGMPPRAPSHMRVSWPDDAYRVKPALWFYELAAEHGSAKGLYESANLHISGLGDIPEDKEKAHNLYKQAVAYGSLRAIPHLGMGLSELQAQVDSGNYRANIMLVQYYYNHSNTKKARNCLDAFIQQATVAETDEAIDFLRTESSFGKDYSSAILYLKNGGQSPSSTDKKGLWAKIKDLFSR